MTYFTRKNYGFSIEECLKDYKSRWKILCLVWIDSYFKDDAKVWWHSLDYAKKKALFDEYLELVPLEKWSHANNKDQVGYTSLFSILKVYGCIQNEF